MASQRKSVDYGTKMGPMLKREELTNALEGLQKNVPTHDPERVFVNQTITWLKQEIENVDKVLRQLNPNYEPTS